MGRRWIGIDISLKAVELVNMHLQASMGNLFRNFTVDHIVPEHRSRTDHIENLQLLCGHCNSVKGDRPQEYLVARLRELGIAA